MAVGQITAEWCATATARLAGFRAATEVADAAIGFIDPETGHRWSMTITEGALADLSVGAVPDADLTVEITAQDWQAALGGAADPHLLARLRVGAGSGPVDRPPSPFDLGWDADDRALPLIPGADLDVQYDYDAGPFGPVTFTIAFRDGRLAELGSGPLDDPEVRVTCTYRQMALVRRGDLDIFDVLGDGGTVVGDEGPLALLGGISESPEFRALEQACGPSGVVLAALAGLVAAPGFADAAAELIGGAAP